MHSMMDSYFPVVSSKVIRFISFAVTFWIVASTVVSSLSIRIWSPKMIVMFSHPPSTQAWFFHSHTHTRLIFMPHCTAFFVDCFFIVRTNHTLISSMLSSCCAVFYTLLSAHLFLCPHCISHTEHTLSIVSCPSCWTVTSAWAYTRQRTQYAVTLKIIVWHQGVTGPIKEGYYICQTVDKIGRWSSVVSEMHLIHKWKQGQDQTEITAYFV